MKYKYALNETDKKGQFTLHEAVQQTGWSLKPLCRNQIKNVEGTGVLNEHNKQTEKAEWKIWNLEKAVSTHVLNSRIQKSTRVVRFKVHPLHPSRMWQ